MALHLCPMESNYAFETCWVNSSDKIKRLPNRLCLQHLSRMEISENFKELTSNRFYQVIKDKANSHAMLETRYPIQTPKFCNIGSGYSCTRMGDYSGTCLEVSGQC